MIAARAQGARRAVLLIWALLVASVAAWPLVGAGISLVATVLALLPLLLPLRGLLRMAPRTLRWSCFTLTPALALALTELLVNPGARVSMALTLGLILAAFSAVIALLRVVPRGG